MSRFADRKTHWVLAGVGPHLGVRRSRSSPALGRIVRIRVVLVCALVSATGCGVQYGLRSSLWEPAAGAVLTNGNVTIRSVSDGWELKTGQFLPTEAGPRFAYSRTNHGYLDYHDGTPFLGCAYGGYGDELLSAYRTDAHFYGIGQSNRVIVEREVSGTVESYQGLMLFLPIAEDADEIAKRRWQVSIPERYFASARGGGISVVYGTYDAGGSAIRGVCEKSSVQPVSWVLWFSDIPLLEE